MKSLLAGMGAAMVVAALLGIAGVQGAGAAPSSSPSRLNVAPKLMQQIQYDEYRTRRGVVKCFRDFVIGPYRCHYYRSPL